MAQYYHLDIERMGVDFSYAHAAALASQLPKGSRTRAAGNPHDRWDDVSWMLWKIERELGLLRWGFVKYENEPQPKPIPYPGQAADEKAAKERFEFGKGIVDAAFRMNGDDNGD